ncbi:MAG: glycosyltransferase [Methanobrevibacter sp.]|nr:glycosyltransferase [Methanobrevibacter sp.]
MCRTIDSILSSTLDNIELILINDGSKDKSWEMAKRYADTYSCVTAIDQENS